MIRKPDPTERDAMDAEACRKLWVCILREAIKEAIEENAKPHLGPRSGTEIFKRWARSRDGRETASFAGFVLDDRAIASVVEFINSARPIVPARKPRRPEPLVIEPAKRKGPRSLKALMADLVEAEARVGA